MLHLRQQQQVNPLHLFSKMVLVVAIACVLILTGCNSSSSRKTDNLTIDELVDLLKVELEALALMEPYSEATVTASFYPSISVSDLEKLLITQPELTLRGVWANRALGLSTIMLAPDDDKDGFSVEEVRERLTSLDSYTNQLNDLEVICQNDGCPDPNGETRRQLRAFIADSPTINPTIVGAAFAGQLKDLVRIREIEARTFAVELEENDVPSGTLLTPNMEVMQWIP